MRSDLDRRDAGESLIEVLVALVLIGIALSAVLGALAAASQLSADHRKDATATVALRSYAEAVKAAPYEERADAGDYGTSVAVAAGYVPVAGYSVAVTGVACWSSGQSDAGSFGDCQGSGERGLQRVDLRVTFGGNRSQSLTVLKRQ